MEQKLLHERQLLARRLEDIEAEVIEKEVSFHQSNKLYFSLTSTPNKTPKKGGLEKEEERAGVMAGGLISESLKEDEKKVGDELKVDGKDGLGSDGKDEVKDGLIDVLQEGEVNEKNEILDLSGIGGSCERRDVEKLEREYAKVMGECEELRREIEVYKREGNSAKVVAEERKIELDECKQKLLVLEQLVAEKQKGVEELEEVVVRLRKEKEQQSNLLESAVGKVHLNFFICNLVFFCIYLSNCLFFLMLVCLLVPLGLNLSLNCEHRRHHHHHRVTMIETVWSI